MIYHSLSPAFSWRQSLLVVAGMLVLSGIGCSRPYEDSFSRARPPVFKAAGRVTWNGSPASGALVTLHSKSHNVAASGQADADGQFALTTWRLGDGAVAGEHAVSIEATVITGYTSDGLPIEVNDMPPKYQNPETSRLTAVISDSDANVLSFDVTGPHKISEKSSTP